MSNELLDLLLQSPVLVAVVGAIATLVTAFGHKPKADEARADEDKQKAKDEKVDEILQINKTLDKHINNSSEPLRKELNTKLDTITISLEAIGESVRSQNMNMSSISKRIDSLEGDVDNLKTFVDSVHKEA